MRFSTWGSPLVTLDFMFDENVTGYAAIFGGKILKTKIYF